MEMLLFSQTLNKCIKSIRPLIFNYTWIQFEVVNRYLNTCYEALESVKNPFELITVYIFLIEPIIIVRPKISKTTINTVIPKS